MFVFAQAHLKTIKPIPQTVFLGSSVVERAAVNRLVGGSNPSPGEFFATNTRTSFSFILECYSLFVGEQ